MGVRETSTTTAHDGGAGKRGLSPSGPCRHWTYPSIRSAVTAQSGRWESTVGGLHALRSRRRPPGRLSGVVPPPPSSRRLWRVRTASGFSAEDSPHRPFPLCSCAAQPQSRCRVARCARQQAARWDWPAQPVAVACARFPRSVEKSHSCTYICSACPRETYSTNDLAVADDGRRGECASPTGASLPRWRNSGPGRLSSARRAFQRPPGLDQLCFEIGSCTFPLLERPLCRSLRAFPTSGAPCSRLWARSRVLDGPPQQECLAGPTRPAVGCEPLHCIVCWFYAWKTLVVGRRIRAAAKAERDLAAAAAFEALLVCRGRPPSTIERTQCVSTPWRRLPIPIRWPEPIVLSRGGAPSHPTRAPVAPIASPILTTHPPALPRFAPDAFISPAVAPTLPLYPERTPCYPSARNPSYPPPSRLSHISCTDTSSPWPLQPPPPPF